MAAAARPTAPTIASRQKHVAQSAMVCVRARPLRTIKQWRTLAQGSVATVAFGQARAARYPAASARLPMKYVPPMESVVVQAFSALCRERVS
jgi:hypothetical protein